jgi:hypothetical protein
MYPYALSVEMEYYVKDNYMEDWGYQDHPKYWKAPNQPGGVPRWIQYNNNGNEITEPAKVPPVTMQDAKEVYDIVLARAGCWPRDHVTKRTLEEVKNQTGSWGRNAPLEPTDEWFLEGLYPAKAPVDSDGDGMPDEWETARGLNPMDPVDANSIVPAGASENNRHLGYSYIEYYINELADSYLKQ